MKKKVIIDCDVGVDDALALIQAFHAAELEVMAVTGVNGNVPIEKVMINIEKVLSLLQAPYQPMIAKGADRPLQGSLVPTPSVHGEDGLGRAEIKRREGTEWWQTWPGPADGLLTQMARQYPNELTLIAIGPLTNLALGLRKDAEGMNKLREVVIMGGAVRTRGNITPYAEFNFFIDPLAAAKVLESGLPITLVPLDVTHQVFLNAQIIEERVRPINNSVSQFVIDATGYNPIHHQFRGGSKTFYLHDPLAVGAVIDPDLMSKEKLALHVETAGGKRYGQVRELTEGKDLQNLEVCLRANKEKFLEIFLSSLSLPSRMAKGS